MARLDCATAYRVHGLQCRNDLARGKNLYLKLIVGRLGHHSGDSLCRAIGDVDRFRPARGEPPFDCRIGLRDRRTGDCSCGEAEAGGAQELATFHDHLLRCEARSRRRPGPRNASV